MSMIATRYSPTAAHPLRDPARRLTEAVAAALQAAVAGPGGTSVVPADFDPDSVTETNQAAVVGHAVAVAAAWREYDTALGAVGEGQSIPQSIPQSVTERVRPALGA